MPKKMDCLTIEDILAHAKFTKQLILRLEDLHLFPKNIGMVGDETVWRKSDVEEWQANQYLEFVKPKSSYPFANL